MDQLQQRNATKEGRWKDCTNIETAEINLGSRNTCRATVGTLCLEVEALEQIPDGWKLYTYPAWERLDLDGPVTLPTLTPVTTESPAGGNPTISCWHQAQLYEGPKTMQPLPSRYLG